MNQIIGISKPGVNASTATAAADFYYSSDYNTFKYFQEGTVQLSINGNGGTQTVYGTVNHSLGYIPWFVAYVNDPENTSRYNIIPYNFSFLTVIRYASAYAGSSSLVFQFKGNYANGTNRTATFYYKVYRNRSGL